MKSKKKNRQRTIDLYLAIFPLAGIFINAFLFGPLPLNYEAETFFATVAQIAITLAGFNLTFIAILLATPKRTLAAKDYANKGLFKSLISANRYSIVYLLLCGLTSLAHLIFHASWSFILALNLIVISLISLVMSYLATFVYLKKAISNGLE